MLKALKLKGFQAHKRLSVRFGGVTTFVGRSDVGKSAIVRALYWLFFTKPSGGGFITEGSKQCEVALKTDVGILKKTRTKSKTVFTFRRQEFKALAGKMPQELYDAIPLNELNFQLQHDPAFWMQISPGQVSAELNRIANLQLIDHSLSFIKSRRTKLKTKKEVAQERVESKKLELDELQFVDAMRKDFAHLETCESEFEKAHKAEQDLKGALEELEQVSGLARRGAALSRDCETLEKAHIKEQELKSQASNLKKLVADYVKNERAGKFLDADMQSVHEAQSKLADTRACRTILIGLIDDMDEQRAKAEEAQAQAESIHKKLHKEFKTCPLCEKKM